MLQISEIMEDEAEEIELDADIDTGPSGNARIVKKNIPIKLKSSSKAQRGRPRKVVAKTPSPKGKDDIVHEKMEQNTNDEIIEAPIFKQPAREPIHQNQTMLWNHKVNLIGEKVVDPLVHCCEKCTLPILLYGRMIPCKHVFCFDCARKTEKNCPRCKDPIQRIEQTHLGTVHICTFDSTKHGTKGCRRTYLSQRDLQAHILHRHLKTTEKTEPVQSSREKENVSQSTKTGIEHFPGGGGHHNDVRTVRAPTDDSLYRSSVIPHMTSIAQNLSLPVAMATAQAPAMPVVQQGLVQPPLAQHPQGVTQDGYMQAAGRPTNLITVQLQDDNDYRRREAFSLAQSVAIPNVTFSTSIPPPGYPSVSLSTVAPPMHQAPPPVSYAAPQLNAGPSMFSSPPPQNQPAVNMHMMSQQPPPVAAPHGALHGLPGGPPRMSLPGPMPGQPQNRYPMGHYEDQSVRGPWTNPPPQRPPSSVHPSQYYPRQ